MPRAAGIQALVNEVITKLPKDLVEKVLAMVDADAPKILSRFPADFGAEIQGIPINYRELIRLRQRSSF